jgi:hypothetical protein
MKRKIINPAADKIAARIVSKTLRFQTRWANFMQNKSERLSIKTKKYFLIFFSILTVTYSCCIIIQSFTGKPKPDFSVTKIHLPATIHEENKPPPVSDKEYLQIERYKKYMDSSGLQIRPGLADSILQIENIYKSTKK